MRLFNGRSTEGWRQAGPGGFRVVDGALQSEGGMGLLWFAQQAFADFVLELDWQVDREGDNSGVFLRFPDPGGDPWVAVHQGYEVQIDDLGAPHGEPFARTGAIYKVQAPTRVASRPPGEWNHYVIGVEGQRYRVTLNGEEVTDFTGDRGLRGHIGLQNHGPSDSVRFRDVVLTPR
jgi:hypothetical protein